MIYPSSTTRPFSFHLQGNPSSLGQATGDLADDTEPTGPDTYEVGDNGQVRLTVTPKPNYPEAAIGGCDMSYTDSVSRGYRSTKDDWYNIEMQIYISFSTFSPSDNELILKGPTNLHPSNSSPCTQGFSYGCRTGCENPTNSEFFKEVYHHNGYSSRGYKSLPDIGNLKTGDWFGIKYCHFEVSVGGERAIKLEHYIDPDGDGTGWIKVNETIDTGGWGKIASGTDGDDDQIGLFGGSRVMWRWDATGGTDLEFKWLSVREIDPNKTFGEDPGNPDTGSGTEDPTIITEIAGQLKLQRDINIDRTNSCEGATGEGGGSGGGAGTVIIYNVPADSDKELSDSSTFSNRTRLAQKVTSSGVVFYNKVVKEFTVPLKRVGTPAASPTVSAKIWNSSNTVVYTSPTTFDPSAFTTSFVDKTFDFSTNTRALVVGDRIGVEYTGSSSSNYVEAGYDSDQTGGKLSQYEDGSWSDKDTRDLAAKMVV